MKLHIIVALAGISLLAPSVPAADQVVFKDQKDKVSYCLGFNIGQNLKRQSIDVDVDKMAKGIKDVLTGAKPQFTEAEIQAIMSAWQKEMQAKSEVQNKVLGDKNKKEGEAFLAANKLKQGVKTLPSGLQYKVVKEGAGASPKATDEVTVNYRGTFIDGTEFDASKNGPVSFPVKGVIPGWTEALQLMKPGAKWQLFVPSNLAYGENGGGPIPPNAALVFDVELVSVGAR